MTGTQTHQLARAIGYSTAYHSSDSPFWKVVPVDVALAVGEATADVCAEICAETGMGEIFDRERFLRRVRDAYDVMKKKRQEEHDGMSSAEYFWESGYSDAQDEAMREREEETP